MAAVPSLHGAWSTLVALIIWRWRPRLWPLGVAYALVQQFAVVYLGEHYVADLLVGDLLALGMWWLSGTPDSAFRRSRERDEREHLVGHVGREQRRHLTGPVVLRGDLDHVEGAEVEAAQGAHVVERLGRGRASHLRRPVPGQKAGSTKSTSNVKYAGPEPTRPRTRSAYAAGPSSRSSSQGRIVMPRSRETW